jgi:predicted nucleic acid-binding protein
LSGYVLDTNLVSETARAKPDALALDWLSAQPEGSLFLTATVIAELASGVERMPHGRRRELVAGWLQDAVLNRFGDRILPFDLEAALEYGALIARARAAGRPATIADTQIAAVASVHGLGVATRDVADYAGFGVPLVNPWQGA